MAGEVVAEAEEQDKLSVKFKVQSSKFKFVWRIVLNALNFLVDSFTLKINGARSSRLSDLAFFSCS